MKKLNLSLAVLLVIASVSGLESAAHAKNISICLKAYSDADTKSQLAACQGMASSFQNQTALPVDNASCAANSRGVGAGWVSEDCGTYDVVLSLSIDTGPICKASLTGRDAIQPSGASVYSAVVKQYSEVQAVGDANVPSVKTIGLR